jgi:hypothetical protein
MKDEMKRIGKRNKEKTRMRMQPGEDKKRKMKT